MHKNHKMTKNFNETSHSKNENIPTNQKGGDYLVIDIGGCKSMKNLLNEQNYPNKLSKREMDSLTALCDTLLPAVDPPETTVDESVIQYFKTSASMMGTPDHVGRIISHRLRHHVPSTRMLLYFLSTRLGTLILGGGVHNFSPRFPFLLKFSKLSPERRQQFVLSMSTSWLPLTRQGFAGMRTLILPSFYNQLDENEENSTWNAIGYCGPDPDFISKKRNESNRTLSYLKNSLKHKETRKSQSKKDPYVPLNKGIFSVKCPQDVLIKSLKRLDFQVSVDHEKNSNQNSVMTIKCDVVVVGSGSGGGVAAGVLASAGYRVLVLEKGTYFGRSNLSLLESPSLDQMYEGGGLVSTRDLGINLLAASTVGGGSTVNWSAALPPPTHVIKEWVDKHELKIFDSPLFKDAFDLVQNKAEVQSGVHDEGLNSTVLRKGCLELGYHVENISRNASADHYCGWCCFGCKDGKKKSTCETWLKDLIDSGNGAILTECEINKVLFERKRGSKRDMAKGVMFEFNTKNSLKNGSSDCHFGVIEAKATVIACGALNTPALLKRSGMKNPNIGKNLYLHPTVMAWGYFPDKETQSDLSSSEGNACIEKEKKSYEGGIMTAMTKEVTEDGALIETPSLHPGVFAALMPWTSGLNLKQRMMKFSRTTHLFALIRDVGSGIISNDPFDIIYKLNPIDEASLQRGIEKMLRILAAAGAEEIGTHHRSGASINVKRVSCHELENFIMTESYKPFQAHSMAVSSAHQMGTCKMGVDPRTSVVNQRGESWEAEGLYVADGSVFPNALGTNPMLTIQALSYCTAQSVIEYLKRKKNLDVNDE